MVSTNGESAFGGKQFGSPTLDTFRTFLVSSDGLPLNNLLHAVGTGLAGTEGLHA